MRKLLLLLIPLFLISFQSNAQFKKLIKQAKEKVMDKVLGDEDSSVNNQPQSPSQSQSQQVATTDDPNNGEEANTPPKPKPIEFPVTGETVSAMRGVYEWVIDTTAIVNQIIQTKQGKYAFELARQKGFKGTNEQVFQQMLKPENKEVMEEINTAVEKKYPQKNKPKGYHTKKWDNAAWSGEAVLPGQAPTPGNNPAWGGIAVPSLYFSSWGGDFNTWITNRYIKSQMKVAHHGMPTIFGVFGIQAAEIADLETNKVFSIGSFLGVKYTKVAALNTKESDDSSRLRFLHIIGVARKSWPVSGIKIEPGPTGMFGPYHTVSEKLIIPVRPFTDPMTGKVSNDLLIYHDALSGRHDANPGSNQYHYDPSYKIIYQYYFTHDLDSQLPQGFLERYKTFGFGEVQGFCVGAKIQDEKGNSADYRLTHVQSDVSVDKGQFQIPEDYPVMTQEEINAAVKKQFSLKNIFKRALSKPDNEN